VERTEVVVPVVEEVEVAAVEAAGKAWTAGRPSL
jgi:hypothetical protein